MVSEGRRSESSVEWMQREKKDQIFGRIRKSKEKKFENCLIVHELDAQSKVKGFENKQKRIQKKGNRKNDFRQTLSTKSYWNRAVDSGSAENSKLAESEQDFGSE
jgi:hypothetical protein